MNINRVSQIVIVLIMCLGNTKYDDHIPIDENQIDTKI